MPPLSYHKTTYLSRHLLLGQPLSFPLTLLHGQVFAPPTSSCKINLDPMIHSLHLTDMPKGNPAKAVSRPDPFNYPETATSTATLSSAPRTMRHSTGAPTLLPRSEATTYALPPRAPANKIQAAAHSRKMLDYDQSPTRIIVAHKEQSAPNASAIADLKSVLPNDSQGVDSRLHASKKHYGNLNARFVAADKEHTTTSQLVASQLGEESKMSSFMAAKLLAEAEAQITYGTRLRERVEAIDQQPRFNDGPQMLRLTASPDSTQHKSDGAFELDTHHTATQSPTQMFNGSETSEDAAYAEVEVQQGYPAMNEQRSQRASGYAEAKLQQDITAMNEHQSPSAHVLQSDDEQAHQSCSVEEVQWQPYTIAQLTPLDISPSNNVTFSWEELVRHFGGNQYSPGLYYSRNEDPSRILQGRTYWLLESQYEPFAPTSPGQHGAKLTAFFNDNLTASGDAVTEDDYSNVPVFACLTPGEGYTYLGQYSQPRYSDKLSYSELRQHVPARVLEYWAKQLADPHRPAWITEQLVAHFWPKDPYTGPIPTDSALTSPATGVTEPNDPERVLEKRVADALERYALKLKVWKKDAELKAALLTEDALMGMWNNTDVDEEKGLRLWWEYLECVGFDEEFYQKLVGLKSQPARRTAAVADMSTLSGDAVGMQSKKAGKQRHDSLVSPVSTDASTIKPSKHKEPTLARSHRPANIAVPGPYPQADLQAAREMHDKATKASDRRRGRSDKQQTLPPHARGVMW